MGLNSAPAASPTPISVFASQPERESLLEACFGHPHLKNEPKENIRVAMKHSLWVEGLPETAGETPIYIVKELGGGMAQVRKIFYQKQNGEIAVKVMKSPLDRRNAKGEEDIDAMNQGIVNESILLQAVAELGPHRNLMNAEHAVVADDKRRKHLVLDMAGDQTVYEWTKKTNDPDQIAGMIFQIMDGVSHMAKGGFVNRDIKLENVMFDGRHFKIVDFGTLSASRVENSHQQNVQTINLSDVRKKRVAFSEEIPNFSPAGGHLRNQMKKGNFFSEYDQLAIFCMIARVLEIKFDQMFEGLFKKKIALMKTIFDSSSQTREKKLAITEMMVKAQEGRKSVLEQIVTLAEENGETEAGQLARRIQKSPLGAMVALAQQVTTAQTTKELQTAYQALEQIKQEFPVAQRRGGIADALS